MEPKKHIYTHHEKKKFLEILKNYSKVIDNKYTHSAALKAKNLAWLKITSEFNSSPVTNLHRTPKQLRRLWMNLKQREREAVARTLRSIPSRGSADDIISGSNMQQVAHALMTAVDSSMDSDIVLEKLTSTDLIQSEPSLCLSEESQNISNQETPLFNTVKIEAISPIATNPPELTESTPINQNRALTTNNKAHITQQEIYQDRIQSNNILEQLLKEKVKCQKEENRRKEERSAAIHNVEYLILKEKLREAKAKADLAELNLRRQNYSGD